MKSITTSPDGAMEAISAFKSSEAIILNFSLISPISTFNPCAFLRKSYLSIKEPIDIKDNLRNKP
jgi:hypothetical protein